MTQDKAKIIYHDIKAKIENCINSVQLDTLLVIESTRFDKLYSEYKILHNRLMSLIKIKRRS